MFQQEMTAPMEFEGVNPAEACLDNIASAMLENPSRKETHADLAKHLRDYAEMGHRLFRQRLVIFGAAGALSAFYYSVRLTIISVLLVVFCEVFDFWTYRRVLAAENPSAHDTTKNLILFYIGTVISSLSICFYVIWISDMQGPTTHFLPLFFLFAASIFASMNNHQVMDLLRTRILMYGLTFLFIPAWDLWKTDAPITSDLWTQMFTSVFVLFFIIDCTRIFLDLYRAKMCQMETLRAEHEKTKVAFKAKTEFLSTMSHELRTPMTSINGGVTLARSGKLGAVPDSIDRVLKIAESNCHRLSMLINDVLDLQKIEAGKLTFDFKAVDLVAFLQRSIEMNAQYGENFGVEFITDLPEGPVYVDADESRMDQVMANLLSNAAKFSNRGDKVTVRLGVKGKSVRIEIVDTGIGLSESKREIVFDAFSQVDSSDTRKIGGTGLGMNITKRILDEHEATIDYRQNDGPGTTFFIDMRLYPGRPANPQPAQSGE